MIFGDDMGEAKRRGTYEDRKRQASKDILTFKELQTTPFTEHIHGPECKHEHEHEDVPVLTDEVMSEAREFAHGLELHPHQQKALDEVKRKHQATIDMTNKGITRSALGSKTMMMVAALAALAPPIETGFPAFDDPMFKDKK
jgi:hypothetical protein